MKYIFIWLFSSIVLTFSSPAQPTIPADAQKLYDKFMSQIKPAHKNWVLQTAQKIKQQAYTQQDIMTASRSYANLNGLAGADIDALAFLVIMNAAKSAQEDIKNLMIEVNNINKQKEQLRKMQNQLKQANSKLSKSQYDSIQKAVYVINSVHTQKIKMETSSLQMKQSTWSVADVNTLQNNMKSELDSMTEMGQAESVRLQMIMDRQSKLITALSNILKKISDTASSITQNLK